MYYYCKVEQAMQANGFEKSQAGSCWPCNELTKGDHTSDIFDHEKDMT